MSFTDYLIDLDIWKSKLLKRNDVIINMNQTYDAIWLKLFSDYNTKVLDMLQYKIVFNFINKKR